MLALFVEPLEACAHPVVSQQSLALMLQVTVSSGGMYLAKLDPADPQLTKQPFSGQEVYSQHKVFFWVGVS
eukprot:m.199636 g.199636  ORF g.199636 m.199636 type:complete len:71 (+) comp53804_c0_seq61:547-759(+)